MRAPLPRTPTLSRAEASPPQPNQDTAMLDRESAAKYINDLLELMVGNRGSDLFITADFPHAIKVDGKVTPVSQQPLNPTQALGLVRSIMNERQSGEFDGSRECNFAISV